MQLNIHHAVEGDLFGVREALETYSQQRLNDNRALGYGVVGSQAHVSHSHLGHKRGGWTNAQDLLDVMRVYTSCSAISMKTDK